MHMTPAGADVEWPAVDAISVQDGLGICRSPLSFNLKRLT
jgi:hypothetical protein